MCVYAYPKHNGGIYYSPSFNGSRTPAYSVSAYGILLTLGRQQLVKQARDIQEAVFKIVEFVRKELPELEVIGDPKVK
jgi:sphinganine-1-phosphate aldolase